MNQSSNDNVSPPFLEINLGSKEWNETNFKNGIEEVHTSRTKREPSNLGQYIDEAATIDISSLRRPRQLKSLLSDL